MANRRNIKGKKFSKVKSQKDDRVGTNRREVWEEKSDARNDFTWYNKNPYLIEATARLPFPYRPGMSIPLGVTASIKGQEAVTKYTSREIPGIMVINYAMSVGFSRDVTSPASLVTKEMYARVRKAFSGSLSVDPPEFLMYIMGIDSIYNQISEMKRVARIINSFSPQNYLVPETLLKSLCPTAPIIEDLMAAKVEIFGYINELVGMVNKFYVPGDMSIFNRHYWLGDNVYTDDASLNSQWYIFKNKYHYKLNISGTYTNLEATEFVYNSTDSASYCRQWYNHIKTLIGQLANSEDAYTINGYFERAYEGVPSFKIEPFGLDEQFLPVYEPEVLAQIENSMAIDVVKASLDVSQVSRTNAIWSTPYTASVTGGAYTTNIFSSLLSIRSDKPDVVQVVEATRLHPGMDPVTNKVGSSTTGQHYVYPASEIVLNYTVQTRGGQIADLSPNSGTILFNSGGIDKDLYLYWINVFSALTQFDWCPIFTAYDVTTEGVWVFGDIHNVTTVGVDVMQQMNKVCLYSMFNVFSQS